MKLVNLACGPVFLAHKRWTNVDFSAVGSSVLECDLLETLPFRAGTFDVVYSSHFLEHIPRSRVKNFLLECKRVLKPGGYIRLVLPDCEEMFSTYLNLRAMGMHQEADFVIIQIIDQCVRYRSGGELGAFYQEILQKGAQDTEYWRSFIATRNGEGLNPTSQVLTDSYKARSMSARHISAVLQEMPNKLYKLLRIKLHNLGLNLLLPAFRRQNISLTSIGEKHFWLWDFYQLKNALEDAGFTCVTRKTHLSSSIDGFPFVPLDSTEDGRPRKGAESMFVEARFAP